MSLRSPLFRLTHLGVTNETPPSDAKYVILTNSVCLLALMVSLVYLLVNFLMENPGVVPWAPPFLSAGVYAVPLWLNSRNRHWAATTFMVVAALLTQLAFTYTFGVVSGNHFYLLPLLGGISLVYPARYRRTAVGFVLLTLAVFVSLVVWGDGFGPLLTVDSRTSRTYAALALAMAAILIAAISYYSGRRTAIAETELQAAQGQMIEAENQALLGRLVAGLLHEVNTPLGAIRSSANSIKRAIGRWGQLASEGAEAESLGRATQVCSELCEALESSTGRVSSVVEGLRQFVRLDEAERKPVDVREALDVTLAVLGPSLGDRIELVRDYPSSPAIVDCFPAKLNRAFLAVLQNAAGAIESQGEIRVGVKRVEDRVQVEIRDDGRGIPAAVLPSIFDFELTRKAGRVGLRLGLPMTKRSLEEISGRLSIESTEGEGTTVRISLPAAHSQLSPIK